MSSTSWTLFWQKLGIDTEKRGLVVKRYRPAKDRNALIKLGVSRDVIDAVHSGTKIYPDELMFMKLSRFARRDINAVMRWTNSNNTSDGFEKLFNIIKASGREVALSRFKELHRIQQFSHKGEGLLFTAKKTINSIDTYNPRELVRRLNIKNQSRYVYNGSSTIGQERLICISKGPKSKPVLKFIKMVSKGNNEIEFSISMDSKKEVSIAKDSLQRYFGSYLDSPEANIITTKLAGFLKKGETKKFMVTSVTYFDNDYKQSVYSAYGRVVNALLSTTYQEKMRNVEKRELEIAEISIVYKDRSINKPIRISFLSFRNEIIGAFLLKADDRDLNNLQAAKLKEDFRKDTGVPLNTFVKTDDLGESAIYRYFLQTVSKRDIKLELRSAKAMMVYKKLLKDNLIEVASSAGEQSKFCVNNNCRSKYRVEWKRKTCQECGELLIFGKNITVTKIAEEKVIDYLKKNNPSLSVKKLSVSILKKKIVIGSIVHDGQALELIPVTSEIKDNHLEILSHRFTNSILITSFDNVEYLERKGFTVISLHHLAHDIEEEKGDPVLDKMNEAYINYASKIQDLANIALKRIHAKEHYVKRNGDGKNLGAELFEADCSVVLDRVLGNSLWLGARHRGVSVPDGFSAFPILGEKHGCIIWDGKFSQGSGVVMGKAGKNSNYIAAAKTNPSIVENGGLKAFVFISNNAFPKIYEKKYRSLVSRKKIKLNFLQSKQLKLLGDHFKKFEQVIQNNDEAKQYYIEMLKNIFFLQKDGKRVEIIEQNHLIRQIADNEDLLRPLQRRRKLAI